MGVFSVTRVGLKAVIAIVSAGLLFQSSRAEEKSDFSRWEKTIAALEQQDKVKPPSKNAIVFVGSSSIRLWDLKKSFPGLDVINRGFGGSQLADSVHFAARLVTKHAPGLVVLYAGDNDIALGKAPERVAADFRAFVQAIHKDLPQTKVIFLSIKPSVLRWKLWDKMQTANKLIEAECKKHDPVLVYVNVALPMLGDDGKPKKELFQSDGLHLNAKGYELWASTLKPFLK
jgi:lysophospholipase L1-like esterase